MKAINPINLIAFTAAQRKAALELATLVRTGQGDSDEARAEAAKLPGASTNRKGRKGRAA